MYIYICLYIYIYYIHIRTALPLPHDLPSSAHLARSLIFRVDVKENNYVVRFQISATCTEKLVIFVFEINAMHESTQTHFGTPRWICLDVQ